jgi:hypothetical protein
MDTLGFDITRGQRDWHRAAGPDSAQRHACHRPHQRLRA